MLARYTFYGKAVENIRLRRKYKNSLLSASGRKTGCRIRHSLF
ncbi:hypothetical protein CHCC20490_1826 [Bacillus paralicheniformis]|nr:hypothetical protein LI7559_06020 [Bacillus licheniformis LMG 7559]KUL19660.1 hypothetical protein LI6934_00100 [Bacillus licheniformis LMG 6934]TWJ63046.1 hypothetical protein CHCC5021_1506 [Bacillus paralicheniformis]TWN96384.1 hypothetical protein CHCC20490_1826 [Bacillus paralicheniformis]